MQTGLVRRYLLRNSVAPHASAAELHESSGHIVTPVGVVEDFLIHSRHRDAAARRTLFEARISYMRQQTQRFLLLYLLYFILVLPPFLRALPDVDLSEQTFDDFKYKHHAYTNADIQARGPAYQQLEVACFRDSKYWMGPFDWYICFVILILVKLVFCFQ